MAALRRGTPEVLLVLLVVLTSASEPPSPEAEAAYVRSHLLLERAAALDTAAHASRAALEEARELLVSAVKLAPTTWQHHNLLGEVYLRQERWGEAAQAFLTTTQLDHNVASAFLKLGLALEHLPQQTQKAKEAKLIAARLNTDYADLDLETGLSLAPSRVSPLLTNGMVAAPPATHGLAVLIPYRDRAEHLRVLLPKLAASLEAGDRGAMDRIFVVEQANPKRWNKGMVYNAGFDYIWRRWGYECLCFHDVDFIPQNPAIRYGCVQQPTHLSSAPSQYGYKVPVRSLTTVLAWWWACAINAPLCLSAVVGCRCTVQYTSFVGGVLQMNSRDFRAVNGYSNRFWSWGKEDDDLYMRFVARNMTLSREEERAGRYECLDHKRDYSNVETNVELLIEQVSSSNST